MFATILHTPYSVLFWTKQVNDDKDKNERKKRRKKNTEKISDADFQRDRESQSKYIYSLWL